MTPDAVEAVAREPNLDYIYLEPECCPGGLDGRTWYADNQTPCDDCGSPWIKYVRVEALTALGWLPPSAQGEIERATLERAAKKAINVANPPEGLVCINLSPSGQCSRSGHRDCLCQERQEAAEDIAAAILALPTTKETTP